MLETPAAARDLRIEAVHRLDFREAVIALRLLGRTNLAEHEVAGAETEAAYLGLRDVGIGVCGRSTAVPEEPVAVRKHLEDAAGQLMALAFGVCQQHRIKEGVVRSRRTLLSMGVELVQ